MHPGSDGARCALALGRARCSAAGVGGDAPPHAPPSSSSSLPEQEAPQEARDAPPQGKPSKPSAAAEHRPPSRRQPYGRPGSSPPGVGSRRRRFDEASGRASPTSAPSGRFPPARERSRPTRSGELEAGVSREAPERLLPRGARAEARLGEAWWSPSRRPDTVAASTRSWRRASTRGRSPSIPRATEPPASSRLALTSLSRRAGISRS